MMPVGPPPHGVLLAELPPDVDPGEISADLADNGVAAPGDQAELAAVVDEAAAEHDLRLSVVVVPDAGNSEQLVELASQLQQQRDGTVLVLSPEFAGARSDRVDSDTLTEALEGLPLDDVQATEAFVDSVTESGTPWPALVLGGALLFAALVAGGSWWERRRRRRRDAAALAAEGARLRDEVAGLADEVLAAEPQVGLRDDRELADEYSQIAVEYQRLTHAVERDPSSRRKADTLSARVRRLRERVEALTAALDA